MSAQAELGTVWALRHIGRLCPTVLHILESARNQLRSHLPLLHRSSVLMEDSVNVSPKLLGWIPRFTALLMPLVLGPRTNWEVLKLSLPLKRLSMVSTWPRNSTLKSVPKRNESICSPSFMHVFIIVIPSSQNMQNQSKCSQSDTNIHAWNTDSCYSLSCGFLIMVPMFCVSCSINYLPKPWAHFWPLLLNSLQDCQSTVGNLLRT